MSLSGSVKALSGVFTFLMFAVPVFSWFLIPGMALGGPEGPALEARWATLAAPLFALVFWALSPKALEIEGGELRILRRAWRAAAYPLSRVEEVAVLPPQGLSGALRIFGERRPVRLLRLVLQEGPVPALRDPEGRAGPGRGRRQARGGLPR